MLAERGGWVLSGTDLYDARQPDLAYPVPADLKIEACDWNVYRDTDGAPLLLVWLGSQLQMRDLRSGAKRWVRGAGGGRWQTYPHLGLLVYSEMCAASLSFVLCIVCVWLCMCGCVSLVSEKQCALVCACVCLCVLTSHT